MYGSDSLKEIFFLITESFIQLSLILVLTWIKVVVVFENTIFIFICV